MSPIAPFAIHIWGNWYPQNIEKPSLKDDLQELLKKYHKSQTLIHYLTHQNYNMQEKFRILAQCQVCGPDNRG